MVAIDNVYRRIRVIALGYTLFPYFSRMVLEDEEERISFEKFNISSIVCNNYILDPSFSLLLSTKNNNYNLTQLLSTFSRKQV